LAITIVAPVYPEISGDSTLSVFATGESHAMLEPCDCPIEPGGGFAERATLLAGPADSGERLIVDAGGFAGGGMYDTYTQGRPIDSQRTVAAINAMAAMHYDAVAVGDDELQVGARWLSLTARTAGLPLISANCFLQGKKRFVSAYRVVVKNGTRIGITALTTPERLFPLDTTIIIEPPLKALGAIWRELRSLSDYQIILSHLGEEAIAALVDSFPEVSMVVNGHRKSSNTPVYRVKNTLVVQFGYQGKKIARADVQFSKDGKKPLELLRSLWIPVAPGTKPDSSVTALLKTGVKPDARSVYDLYIMSQCSYGRAALREILDFSRRISGVEWNVWFIGEVRGDSLSSLHGSDEVHDEMLWLAVRSLFPGRWISFLQAMSADSAATLAVIRMIGLDTGTLYRWIGEKGRAALSDHYRRSARLAVTASPTLFINNAVFEKEITVGRLSKLYCAGQDNKPVMCDSLPECFDDGDCRKKGFIGVCGKTGACSYEPDQAFLFSVVVADSTFSHPERTIISTTEELFPHVTVATILLASVKGRSLMKTYAPESLPFYLFDTLVYKAHNFSRIESGLKRVAKGYTFKKGVTSINYFLRRNPLKGRIAAFLDPIFPDAMGVAASLLSDSALSGRARIFPVFYSDTLSKTSTVEEVVRREEALRWLILDSLYSKKFAIYLLRYASNPGSTIGWLDAIDAAGIDAKEFASRQRAGSDMLVAHWNVLESLSLKEPISLLIDNRELILLRNRGELSAVLDHLKK
jgi:hypothetical protein